MKGPQIEMPLELAYNHLFQQLSNLGFLVEEIEARDPQEGFAQIVFSVTTRPTSHHVEYFSLRRDDADSTILEEVDITGGRWHQSILKSWRMLEHRRNEIVEEVIFRAA